MHAYLPCCHFAGEQNEKCKLQKVEDILKVYTEDGILCTSNNKVDLSYCAGQCTSLNLPALYLEDGTLYEREKVCGCCEALADSFEYVDFMCTSPSFTFSPPTPRTFKKQKIFGCGCNPCGDQRKCYMCSTCSVSPFLYSKAGLFAKPSLSIPKMSINKSLFAIRICPKGTFADSNTNFNNKMVNIKY